MSEYQYYEFQAVERPLTKDEMGELRAISSRAKITPTRFTNVYHYGDFRGAPGVLMERYFDGFVYLANWGTRQCMLRVPKPALDPETVRRYCVTDGATLRITPMHLILELASEQEDIAWHEEEEDAEWLPSLLPLRAELEQGDLRPLYLAWLHGADAELDDDAAEPPVPPVLGNLSAAQQAFAEFLRIDADLIAVAAERSAAAPLAGPSPAELERWIGGLPEADKNALLLRLPTGDAPHLTAELRRRFRHETAPAQPVVADAGGRTVGELYAAAAERAETRARQEAEREAKERAHREREQAAARIQYLDGLATREESAWREVESLIESKRPTEYDRAVGLLKDLGELAARDEATPTFASRVGGLRARHARKVSLLERLDEAGLPRG